MWDGPDALQSGQRLAVRVPESFRGGCSFGGPVKLTSLPQGGKTNPQATGLTCR